MCCLSLLSLPVLNLALKISSGRGRLQFIECFIPFVLKYPMGVIMYL